MAGKDKLTARGAATSKPGRYGDGGGLYLVVSARGVENGFSGSAMRERSRRPGWARRTWFRSLRRGRRPINLES
jgi:hypothetical protein